MSNLPDQPDPHRLRVSDADREQAAEVLRTAAGDGRITIDELDERLEAAYGAKTYGDLAAVTADLPLAGPKPPAVPGAAVPAQPGTFPADRIGGTPGPGVSIAVMSGVDRAGGWVVPPRHTVFTLMGGVQLDLREARFSEREVTIDVLAIMGGVDIIVVRTSRSRCPGSASWAASTTGGLALACPAPRGCGWSGSPSWAGSMCGAAGPARSSG
ncbi:MAG: DUF1707 domain-containing protein, partial [Streptosporangiales bacterium]